VVQPCVFEFQIKEKETGMARQITYRDSGVDIYVGDRLVDYITSAAKTTFGAKGVLAGIGGFNAAFALPAGYTKPVLVSCTDGVGTKLKIAFELKKHDTVGIDLVAMSVNDLICCGAKPLFFLDYFATGKLSLKDAKEAVKGIVRGCVISRCALIGGETAEMPDFYQKGEYDMAGFAVGVVERDKIIDGRNIRPGDKVIGLASSGLHSNGFSLVRKLFKKSEWKRYAKELLCPTRIYADIIMKLISKYNIKGIAHITGGGLVENAPRILPKGTGIRIKKGTWPVPGIFREMQKRSGLPDREMFRTFNMGIGMVLVVPESQAKAALKSAGKYVKAYLIGDVEKGKQAVEFAEC